MANIIYKSDSIIPWDTQSAFKMTSYNTSSEENMVFRYLKAYVHGKDLVLCSYCFTEIPRNFANIHLYINPNPESNQKLLEISYGFSGIEKAVFGGECLKEKIGFNSFKTDDEQGFYWCGEITVSGELLEDLCNVQLKEKSLITLNLTQTFINGDFAVLFGNRQEENYSADENTEVFVVLNY